LVGSIDEHAETLVDECADPYAATAKESLRPVAVSADDLPIKRGRRAAFLHGFSVHANVSIGAGKREALEMLCRYGARPPIALGRLGSTRDGKITYRVKHRAPGKPAELILTKLELLEKIAALIPPPRVHLVRYHGVLAPNAKWRSRIVPRAADSAPPSNETGQSSAPRIEIDWVPPRPSRLDWAALLLRVFKIDVLQCDRCGGRMRVLAFITDPDVTHAILSHLGLPTAAPSVKPARSPPPDPAGSDHEPSDDGFDPFPPDDM
jgi:hypothetical protein